MDSVYSAICAQLYDLKLGTNHSGDKLSIWLLGIKSNLTENSHNLQKKISKFLLFHMGCLVSYMEMFIER